MSEVPIHSPEELRGRSVEELRFLAEDIRQRIVSVSLKNGGHLGASLGTVELAIALHTVFRSPDDSIVWDVGHQAYAHKLLTGRWDSFATLRQKDGVSGFLSRKESKHDAFGAGHSSTSLSAALAMAWARGRGPLQGRFSIAVIGDGGLTAGIAFEALNNVAANGPIGPLLVVLNDNQMSISPNVGGIPAILGQGQIAELSRLFGFDYIGPVDGHDLETLIPTLEGIRSGYAGRPILLHALTEKGRGYAPAEQRPAAYHGVAPVPGKVADPAKGSGPEASGTVSWSQAMGDALCEAAERDERVVAITAAMPEGTGLSEFARRFPQRFFDVGIAEPHAVTFAAGLATQGYKPVVAVYSTFLQRAYDSIIHDVALQNLGVTFAIDRAGAVGADGPTHHGAFDLSYLGLVPGMTVTAPATREDLKELLAEALAGSSPFAIRYPRGASPSALPGRALPGVRWLKEESSPRLFVVAAGASAARALKAAQSAGSGASGSGIALAAVTRIKPLPEALIQEIRKHPRAKVLTVEDGALYGGFGHALSHACPGVAFEHAGYGDHFIPQGTPAELEELEGVSAQALSRTIARLL
jgi:1-deoxy-D-xylulose-5-phosphate synthase